MEKYHSKFNTCIGPSMYPTLKSGDGLILCQYNSFAELNIGDIIIYPHPGKTFHVVHRIIKKLNTSVITRGDNNNKVDPYFIKYDVIIGKIIEVKRGNRSKNVLSGKIGYLLHRLLITKIYILSYFMSPLRYVSNKLIKYKIFNFCHCMYDLGVIKIECEDSHKYILRHHNKAIGIKSLETDNHWRIKFPYKLFINVNKI